MGYSSLKITKSRTRLSTHLVCTQLTDSVDLGWELKISMSNKFPHTVNAVDPGTTL